MVFCCFFFNSAMSSPKKNLKAKKKISAPLAQINFSLAKPSLQKKNSFFCKKTKTFFFSQKKHSCFFFLTVQPCLQPHHFLLCITQQKQLSNYGMDAKSTGKQKKNAITEGSKDGSCSCIWGGVTIARSLHLLARMVRI